MKIINLRYLFRLPDSRQEIIDVCLDAKSLDLVNEVPANLPYWTALDFRQCNAEETVYRATSTYLLAQYFLQKEGEKADMELEGLKRIYSNIRIINESMAERLRAVGEKDVALNSLIILDMFAQTLPFAIEDSLEEIRHLFKPYFYHLERYLKD
jgi:hypothetical protein